MEDDVRLLRFIYEMNEIVSKPFHHIYLELSQTNVSNVFYLHSETVLNHTETEMQTHVHRTSHLKSDVP